MKELYNKKINERSIFKYFLGLLSRIRLYLKYGLIRMYARIRGAYIGRNSIITWKLACRANKNLVIGNDCIVESWNIDLRSKVEICDNVIINRDVVIIRVSHYIDNDKSFTTRFYPDLKIEMYCWLWHIQYLQRARYRWEYMLVIPQFSKGCITQILRT